MTDHDHHEHRQGAEAEAKAFESAQLHDELMRLKREARELPGEVGGERGSLSQQLGMRIAELDELAGAAALDLRGLRDANAPFEKQADDEIRAMFGPNIASYATGASFATYATDTTCAAN